MRRGVLSKQTHDAVIRLAPPLAIIQADHLPDHIAARNQQ